MRKAAQNFKTVVSDKAKLIEVINGHNTSNYRKADGANPLKSEKL